MKAFRRVALAAAWAYATYTLWLIARMFWFICYSMTRAIHLDELVRNCISFTRANTRLVIYGHHTGAIAC